MASAPQHLPPPPPLSAGEAGTACARALAPGGTLVSYGAMSQQPLALPPGLLIFNDIRVRGFWLTGGYAQVRVGEGRGGRGGWANGRAGIWFVGDAGMCGSRGAVAIDPSGRQMFPSSLD